MTPVTVVGGRCRRVSSEARPHDVGSEGATSPNTPFLRLVMAVGVGLVGLEVVYRGRGRAPGWPFG